MNCRLQQNVDVFGLQLRLTSIMPAKPSLDLITRRLVATLATCTSLLVKHTNQHLLVLKHLPLQLNERLVAGIVPADVSCRLILPEVLLWNDHVKRVLSQFILQEAILLRA